MAPSFIRYILKFKTSDCASGDVARDIKMDPSVNRNWGYKTFKKYLEDRGASDRCLAVVEELYQAYGAIQGKLYK